MDNITETKIVQAEKETVYGFLVEADFLRFLRFFQLVRTAEQVLAQGFIVHGSFVHYLVWCEHSQMVPTEVDTVKKFIASGRHIPQDLDVYSETGQRFVSVFQRCVRVKRSADYGCGDCCSYTMETDSVLPSCETKVDFLFGKGLRRDRNLQLDFSVNSLSFETSRGFFLDAFFPHQNCPTVGTVEKVVTCSLKCLWNQLQTIQTIKAEIINQTGGLIDIQPSQPRRKVMVRRLHKMIDRKFTISSWDTYYPKHTPSEPKESVCIVCREYIQVGQSGYKSFCNGSFSKNKLFCPECFWAHLESQMRQDDFVFFGALECEQAKNHWLSNPRW